MIKKIILYFYISLQILICYSCLNNKSERKKETIQLSSEENFEKFLEKFKNDSTFRYERIKFPIEGFNSESSTKTYIWTKKDWAFYSQPDFDNKNEINTEIKRNDSIIIWRLYIEDSGYDIKYIFNSNKGKWYLSKYLYSNI